MSKRERPYIHLSPRETQIMEVLYARGTASVQEVRNSIADFPSYNSIRVILGILEDKGFITHKRDGRRYVYRPKQPVESAKRTAMRHLLKTFFQGSTPLAVSAFIDMAATDLTDEELSQLAKQVRLARKEIKR